MRALFHKQQAQRNASSSTKAPTVSKIPIGEDFLYGEDLKERTLENMKEKGMDSSKMEEMLKHETPDLTSWMNLEAKKQGKDDKDDKDYKDVSAAKEKELVLAKMKEFERMRQESKVNIR